MNLNLSVIHSELSSAVMHLTRPNLTDRFWLKPHPNHTITTHRFWCAAMLFEFALKAINLCKNPCSCLGFVLFLAPIYPSFKEAPWKKPCYCCLCHCCLPRVKATPRPKLQFQPRPRLRPMATQQRIHWTGRARILASCLAPIARAYKPNWRSNKTKPMC